MVNFSIVQGSAVSRYENIRFFFVLIYFGYIETNATLCDIYLLYLPEWINKTHHATTGLSKKYSKNKFIPFPPNTSTSQGDLRICPHNKPKPPKHFVIGYGRRLDLCQDKALCSPIRKSDKRICQEEKTDDRPIFVELSAVCFQQNLWHVCDSVKKNLLNVWICHREATQSAHSEKRIIIGIICYEKNNMSLLNGYCGQPK